MNNIHEKLKEIECEYKDLQSNIEQYANNCITSADLKKKGSKFGIYEQKGKTMMLRLKAVGGELSLKKLKNLAEIMRTYKIPYMHLSTRQNYQLHEVPFENVKSVIEACNEKEMYFRGGGGNTFRSILVSTFTGVSEKNTFDVMPYARMIENEVFFYDKAFDFGRKLKVGLANNSEEEFVVAIQDLGFLAKEINGKKGFKVYCGGGMGRNSRLGHTLIEFLPEEDILKTVKTIIDIFYEFGDRTNRMKARLRFLVEEMGIDKFRELFLEYFNKSNVKNGPIPYINYEKKVKELLAFKETPSNLSFNEWKKVCTRPTKFKNIVSLALYVKNGDLSVEKLEKLIKILDELGISLVRATINQNLVIPLIHESALEHIYNYLDEKIPEIVTETLSIRGKLRCCVGSTICMIGIQDSMKIGDAIGVELDNLANERPEYRDIIFKEAKNIRVSGCPSSCAGIPIAPLGFIGLKKRINDVITDCMQVYIGGILTNNTQALSYEVPNLILPINEIPNYVKNIFEEYLKTLETYNIDFTEFMYKKRLNEEFKKN
ncbi:nitrite/sulfite reductase [Cetobacterium sp. 2A]|uniref:nitrite/sulfite reductase n=1 Tax=Cetobacterium sp. 2A TaxID=2754723 RepID=UPI00163BE0DB|nr:nitrite/sulfite reductase [Cetobacterium sp. 2A]MBC2854895.1 nitrite/sulfite reductase [Cetobacterium sp. 2A]